MKTVMKKIEIVENLGNHTFRKQLLHLKKYIGKWRQSPKAIYRELKMCLTRR